MKPLLGLLVMLGAVFFTLSPSALAEDPPLHNARDEASVIETRVEKEADDAYRRKKGDAPVEVEELPPPASADPSLRFRVSGIQFKGNTVLPASELDRLATPYENRETTLADLQALARQVTQEYRRRGYITSRAYLPEQRLEDGNVTVQVVEGRIGAILVEGNEHFRSEVIRSYFPMEPGDILNYTELRRALTRVNEKRDRQVRSILRRGEKEGTSDVLLRVTDTRPMHAGALFDNQGGRTSGKKRFGLSLIHENLTGHDDTGVIGTLFGSHFGALFTRYELPVAPAWGTSLLASFSHVKVAPKKELDPFGVEGVSQSYSAGVLQRVLETDRLRLNVEAGMQFKESRTLVLAGTFRRERLRILHLEPVLEVFDRGGTTRLGTDFSFAVNALGAGIHSDPSSGRQGLEPAFFKMRQSLERQQRMPWGTRVRLRGEYQLPASKLPSSEALYLGGADSVRGYPDGDYLADAGLWGSVEYLIPAFFLPEEIQLPRSAAPLRRDLDLVVFFDQGYGRLRGPSPAEVRSRHLMGAGAGLRMRVYQNLFARLEWGYALGQHPLDAEDRLHFHFRVQAEV